MMKNSSITNRLANDIKNVPQSTGLSFATSLEKQPGQPSPAPVSGLGVMNDTRDNSSMACNLLEFNQVCNLLKIGRSTLYSLVNKKAIRAVKLLGRTLFREGDVYDFVATLPEYEGGPNEF